MKDAFIGAAIAGTTAVVATAVLYGSSLIGNSVSDDVAKAVANQSDEAIVTVAQKADDLAQMSDELTVVVDKADEATEVIEQTVKTTQQGIVGENTEFSSIGNAKQYSTMYEANVGSGKSRSAHRNAANKQFYDQMKDDLFFKESVDDYFGYDVIEHMNSGKNSLKNPSSDWVWHHPVGNPNVVQLIPKKQHQASSLQSVLHSGVNGAGGFGLYY